MPNDTFANWEEYEDLIERLSAILNIDLEWIYATGSGWHDHEFLDLYAAYVTAARHRVEERENAAEVKGDPLENILRYFLEKGGLAYGVRSIGKHQVWQVDGQGRLRKTQVLKLWGDHVCEVVGCQLYAEGKNHIDPLENEEFAIHFTRMQDHDCRLGVILSTSGYRIGGGKGIAVTVERHYLSGTAVHLLLVFESMRRVAVEREAPLAVLTEALTFVQNERYTSDRSLQEAYSSASCHEIVDAEYRRINGMVN